VGQACIDPSNRIGDIGTIYGDFITDKEILRHILLHPFAKSDLLLNSPSTVPYLPYLQRGFLHGSRERKGCEEEDEESDQKVHESIYKNIGEELSTRGIRYSIKLFLDKQKMAD
jgi:hypothetical protein